MDRLDFIRALFSFCSVRDEDGTLLRSYDLALSTSKPIDWDKLYRLVLQESEKRQLQAPKWYIGKLPYCIKSTLAESKNEGYKLRVWYQSGSYADFVVCGASDITLKALREQYKTGNNRIKQAILYPPEVTLIGRSIYPEDAIGEVVYMSA